MDTHTKWVEATPIPSKHTFVTARWFYKDIIARWGKPVFIRRDNGREWLGEFEEQLIKWGIQSVAITIGNSKANG